MRSKVTTVEFPVFCDFIVHVEITSNMEKSLAKYPPTKNIEVDNHTGGLAVHEMDEPFSFIFLPYNASVGSIAHEAWHVVKHMMDFAGVELDSETCAYHLGFLTDKIFKFMRGKHDSRRNSKRNLGTPKRNLFEVPDHNHQGDHAPA